MSYKIALFIGRCVSSRRGAFQFDKQLNSVRVISLPIGAPLLLGPNEVIQTQPRTLKLLVEWQRDGSRGAGTIVIISKRMPKAYTSNPTTYISKDHNPSLDLFLTIFLLRL
jgi:hypothetical protein